VYEFCGPHLGEYKEIIVLGVVFLVALLPSHQTTPRYLPHSM